MSETQPSFRQAAQVWAKIGLTSFGGPAGQIALMHRELVEDRRWISNERFLHALNYCMLLPGPEAQQLATYIGWTMFGVRGGLAAGGLFILPGFIAIMLISIAYASWGSLGISSSILLGLKAAVLAIVVQAIVKLGKRALKTTVHLWIAAAAFAALALLSVPFPIVVLGALALGAVVLPRATGLHTHDEQTRQEASAPPRRTARTLVICLALWVLPLGLALGLLGSRHVFVELGVFFSKTALVTFGGAYAVLGYVGVRAVDERAWLTQREMVDGLGLAETTPGPLILVLQFVGFLAAYRNPGTLSPLMAGILGATLTVWVTFVPSFTWIFVGAPYVERLRTSTRIAAALEGVTASAVGVMLNLSLWFGSHVLFSQHDAVQLGFLRLSVPSLASLDLLVAGLALGTGGLLLRTKLSVVKVLALATLAGTFSSWLLGRLA